MRRIGSSTNYEPLDDRAVPGLAAAHRPIRMRNSECGMRNGRAEVGSRDSAFRIRHSALGLSHHRPPALRRRRRLVRRPLRAPQPARRHPPAHRAPRRRARARGHAHRPRAVGRPLPLYDGPRERPLLRRGGADPAPLARAGRLPPRRRRLRDGPVVPARDRAGLPRPSAGRGAAQPPRLSPGIRLSEGDPQDPRARRAAGAGVRRVLGRPSRRILFVSDGPRRRLGRSRGPSRSSGAPRGGAAHGRESFHLRRELDPVTDTAARLRRLGLPHARARAGAVLLASAGVAFAIAAAGLALAPRIAAVLGAWLLLAAPAVGRLLARDTRATLVVGGVAVAVGAALFVAAAPAGARAAAFWHPLRTLADARAPVRLAVDRATVRRGDSVTVTITVPAGSQALLWTRGPGEPWRPARVALDSLGRATRRLGPLAADLYLRATSGGRKSAERRVTVAVPAFVAGLELTARYPAYLARPDEPLLPGADPIPIPAGTVILTNGTASVPLAGAAWRRGDGGARAGLAVEGGAFSGRLAPAASGTWRLDLATVDGSPLEGDVPELRVRVVPDSAPVVTVPVPGKDTTLPLSLRQPLVIDARDDHGLSRLQ